VPAQRGTLLYQTLPMQYANPGIQHANSEATGSREAWRSSLNFIHIGPYIMNRYSIIVQQDATYSVYYIPVDSSTCSGC